MVTPAAEREAVVHLKTEHEMSERRACQLLQCCRMTMRYASVKPDDTVLRDRMKAIARERRRFGYRRIHIMLKREGTVVIHKKLFRLYREEKLSVRNRPPIGICFAIACRARGRPQKSTWHTRTNACATHAEPEMVNRLRVGPVPRLSSFQSADSD
jgi:transposase InsO family protein